MHAVTRPPAARASACAAVGNHGVGRQQAIDNTRRMAEHMIEEFTQQHGLTAIEAEIGQDVRQLALF